MSLIKDFVEKFVASREDRELLRELLTLIRRKLVDKENFEKVLSTILAGGSPARAARTFPRGYACTLTFGDRAENHAGMQLLGEEAENGFSMEDLEAIRARFALKGAECEIISLNEFLPEDEKAEAAGVLVIRNALDYLPDCRGMRDECFAEQLALPKDTKAFMKGRVVNKLARYNLCFGEEKQNPDYENGKGTIVAYDEVPVLKLIREQLPEMFGEKAETMWCEGNYYYDASKCGIGFHGDGERKRVIGLRLGESIPLHYQWFRKFKPLGERCILTLNHGDMYVMSEKAVGQDWKKSSLLSLRHAAGCKKYTTILE